MADRSPPAFDDAVPPALRIDRLLWFLRLAPTRGAARALVEQGHIRLDGRRVERAGTPVRAGATLVVPAGRTVRVLHILALPSRRGGAAAAAGFYAEADTAT